MKNMMKRLKDQRGLTLIELLAVIVILGIIAAIAIPSIGGIIQKSKEDAVKADAIQVLNAAKIHISSTGMPDTTDTLTKTDLSGYLEEVSLTDYTVTVIPPTTTNETQYKISGYGPAGSKTVTFTNATLTMINDDDAKNNSDGISVTDTPASGKQQEG